MHIVWVKGPSATCLSVPQQRARAVVSLHIHERKPSDNQTIGIVGPAHKFAENLETYIAALCLPLQLIIHPPIRGTLHFLASFA